MKSIRICSRHLFLKSVRIHIFVIIFYLASLPRRLHRAPTVINVFGNTIHGSPLVLMHNFETASVTARKNLGTGTISKIPIISLSMCIQNLSISIHIR